MLYFLISEFRNEANMPLYMDLNHDRSGEKDNVKLNKIRLIEKKISSIELAALTAVYLARWVTAP